MTAAGELRERAAGHVADADGFCVVGAYEGTGCAEHLRRFDDATGARLDGDVTLPWRKVDPWANSSPEFAP